MTPERPGGEHAPWRPRPAPGVGPGDDRTGPPGSVPPDGSGSFVPIELAQTGPRSFTLRADLVHPAHAERTGVGPGPGAGPGTTSGAAPGTPTGAPDETAVVVVPAGFTTDLASVPFPLWALIGPFGRHTRAAILHDFGCSLLEPPLRTAARYREREAVDRRFRRVLLDSGVPRLRAVLMWGAVSVGRVVVHGSPLRVAALVLQLAVGLVLLGVAVAAPLPGPWRVGALLTPLALSALWRREWPVLAIAHYAGALVLPALVVNLVTGGALTLLGLAWRGRPGDIVPTRVGDA